MSDDSSENDNEDNNNSEERGREMDDRQNTKVLKYPGPSLEEYKSGRGRDVIKVSIIGFVQYFHSSFKFLELKVDK